MLQKLAYVFLITSFITTSLQAKLKLGTRVLENGIQTLQLDTPKEIQTNLQDKQIHITLNQKNHGWFATQRQYPLAKQTQLTTQIQGNVAMQIEWFSSRGKFLDASDILTSKDFSNGLQTLIINDQVPSNINRKARYFRPKFWIYGHNATAQISIFKISSPRMFRKKGLQLKHTWIAGTRLSPDPNITVKHENNLIHITKDNTRENGGMVFEDRVPFDPKGVIMIDVHSFAPNTPGVSLILQTICWDQAGKYLCSIDLIKRIQKDGTYEIAPAAYGSAIPKETVKLNFKLWTWGTNADYKLNGLYWATPAPEVSSVLKSGS